MCGFLLSVCNVCDLCLFAMFVCELCLSVMSAVFLCTCLSVTCLSVSVWLLCIPCYESTYTLIYFMCFALFPLLCALLPVTLHHKYAYVEI